MSTLALDLGATKLAARLDDVGGVAAARLRLGRSEVGGTELDELVRFVSKLRAGARSPLEAAALAAAPTLDPAGRVARWPSRPHWAGLPLRRALETALSCPLAIDDDGNAAALAEARAQGASSLVYVGLGTGVGGGIVLGGELHRGRGGRAGEIGHLPVSAEGPVCACGRRGCLQAFASGPAIRASAFPSRRSASDGDLRRALDAGAPGAQAALERAADALARAVVALSELLEPEVVALGGGVVAGLPELLERVEERLSGQRRAGQRLPRVRRAVHGADASLEGAAILAREAARSACQEAS